MRKNFRRRGFDCGDFAITKREILASIAIIAVMLVIGILISYKISEHQLDQNEVYNKAVKIKTQDLFQYGMDTNIGNAFVYGDLKAVDTVTYPEIGGKYMSVEKVKERYTRHTRTVTRTRTVNGKTQTYTETEVYWTWDAIERWSEHCDKVSFLGIKFDYGQIYTPSEFHIDTQKESSSIRYVYYGSDIKYTGTIFTSLKAKTVNNTKFYNNKNIEETVEYIESGGGVIIFWVIWVFIIGCCVFGFYYLDNKWLE
ncbi:hypothetical protein [uncultured Robinsoniella sp.]|uniref:hypothetical protein n=1 Tax=uncultured Robinsoniella sp. TaxID=904190 RepID=UPI00374F40AE